MTSTSNSSSLGSLSFTDKDDQGGELTLDMNKLSQSQIERKLTRYFNKDYVSTCNVALYGTPSSTSGSYIPSNYLSILKAIGNGGGVLINNNRQQQQVAKISEDNIEI